MINRAGAARCATISPVPVVGRFLLEPVDRFGLLDRSGPAVHAAVLRAVRARDEDLADRLHLPVPGPKPLAIKPLVQTDDGLGLTVVVLDDAIGRTVVDAIADRPGVRLLHTWAKLTPQQVHEVTPAQLRDRAAPHRRWHVELRSPCTFRTTGATGVPRSIPYPDPVRVVSTLTRRLARFSPELADTAERADRVAGAHLAVASHRLGTARRLVKAPDVRFVGAVGWIRFELLGAVTDDDATAVDLVLRYGELAGVGDRTAVGMGDVRVLDTTKERR